MDATGQITQEIIQRIRTEGRSGIDAFTRHHGPKLLVFVRYKLGNQLKIKVDPEDVLQDFFIAVLENRDGFLDRVDERGVHRTVFRMLENRIRDLYKHYYKTKKRDGKMEVRERRDSNETGGISMSQLPGPDSSFTQQIESQDEYHSLQRLLEQLDDESQRLFVLKFVQELTNQEIANELEVSVSTVKRNSSDLIQLIQKLRS